jgi:predicted ester cyclase
MPGREAGTVRPMPAALSTDLIDDFIRRLQDGYNQRDVTLIEQMLGDHLIDHSEDLGRMDLRQRIHRVQTALPDSRYEVVEHLVQGHAVAWTWTISGTHTEEILGCRPTGRKVVLPGLSVVVIIEGKVVEHWEFADLKELLAQIQD